MPTSQATRSRVVAFATGKGGVGKTSLATHVAASLAAAPRSGGVLLVDLDPQQNATRRLVAPEDVVGPGVAQVLTGAADLADVIVTSRVGEDLEVLRAGTGLDHVIEVLPGMVGAETLLQRTVTDPARGVWRWIVLDLPPSMGKLTSAGLVAADIVVSPVMADGDSVGGAVAVRDRIQALRDAGLATGVHAGAVVVARKPGPGGDVAVETLQGYGFPVLGEIPDRKSWPNSQTAGLLAWEYTGGQAGKKMHAEVAAIVQRIKKVKVGR